MEIKFSKRVDDGRVIDPFITMRESRLFYGDNLKEPKLTRSSGLERSDLMIPSDAKEIYEYQYDYEGLTRFFVDQLEEAFSRNSYGVTPVSDNELWIDPDRFSLELMAREDVGDSLGDICTEGHGRLKLKGNKQIKSGHWGIFSYQIPVYEEQPSIILSGKVTYEYREDIDPVNVINLLKKEGYNPRVIPTKKEEVVVL